MQTRKRMTGGGGGLHPGTYTNKNKKSGWGAHWVTYRNSVHHGRYANKKKNDRRGGLHLGTYTNKNKKSGWGAHWVTYRNRINYGRYANKKKNDRRGGIYKQEQEKWVGAHTG